MLIDAFVDTSGELLLMLLPVLLLLLLLLPVLVLLYLTRRIGVWSSKWASRVWWDSSAVTTVPRGC